MELNKRMLNAMYYLTKVNPKKYRIYKQAYQSDYYGNPFLGYFLEMRVGRNKWESIGSARLYLP